MSGIIGNVYQLNTNTVIWIVISKKTVLAFTPEWDRVLHGPYGSTDFNNYKQVWL